MGKVGLQIDVFSAAGFLAADNTAPPSGRR